MHPVFDTDSPWVDDLSMIDRVDVAVIVALDLEAAPLRDRLEGAVRLQAGDTSVAIGRLGSRSVAIAVAGMGMVAGRATRKVIDGHRPTLVVAAGICGGLVPEVAAGTVVVADGVARGPKARPDVAAATSGTSNRSPDAPAEVFAFDAETLRRLSRPPVHGLVVTADEVVATPDAKRALAAATGAIVVDLESWWIVTESGRAGLPAAVVRAVSDTAATAIPADIARLAGMSHAMRRAGAAARLLWRRPAAIVELVELREQAHRAADRLAVHLAELIG
jgi:adenosylhomocysteine nucleosidase